MLNFTPPDLLVDSQDRPYFLWDSDTTLEQFRVLLDDPDPVVRAYALGKLMRQAKPDDVFQFVTLSRIRADWPELSPFLGEKREFWAWLLAQLEALHGR